MADRTERRLTRDLMLEAVPLGRKLAGGLGFSAAGNEGNGVHILQPTSLPLERSDPWVLNSGVSH